MSIIGYAKLTNIRDLSDPNKENSPKPSSITHYLDAMAALVPAEVLSLHAIILTFTTASKKDEKGVISTSISDPEVLSWVFWGLIILSILLFFVSRVGKLDKFDWLRALIPPFAFVCWTMLQKTTAFDAVCIDMDEASRIAIALFLAVGLGLLATFLAKKADEKNTSSGNKP